MTDSSFDIQVGEVSDLEARVIVRYRGEPAELRGCLRGPYCEHAHTLPAEYPLMRVTASDDAFEAIVTDPCAWSPELPHLYRVEVEAVRDDAIVATYQSDIGLRRTTPTKNWDHIK